MTKYCPDCGSPLAFEKGVSILDAVMIRAVCTWKQCDAAWEFMNVDEDDPRVVGSFRTWDSQAFHNCSLMIYRISSGPDFIERDNDHYGPA